MKYEPEPITDSNCGPFEYSSPFYLNVTSLIDYQTQRNAFDQIHDLVCLLQGDYIRGNIVDIFLCEMYYNARQM